MAKTIPRSSIALLIKRSHSLWLDLIEPGLAAQGLTSIQYTILVWLTEASTVTSRDICGSYRHDSGALTRIVDQLAERGLLERIRDNADRRKVNLRLTPAGRTVVEAAIPHVVAILNTGLGDFSNREMQDFTCLLLKLNGCLQSQLDPTTALGEERA